MNGKYPNYQKVGMITRMRVQFVPGSSFLRRPRKEPENKANGYFNCWKWLQFIAERELAVQALPARLQCRANTRLVTMHPGRLNFRGISLYLMTLKLTSSVYCALLANNMVKLREIAQERGRTSRVLPSGELHYSATKSLKCIRHHKNEVSF